jgi:hypothetical protein
MILQVFLILSVSNTLCIYPNPMIFSDFEIAGTFLWFEVELLVFNGTLLSNMIFIFFRTLVRHKIVLDQVPEKKQLPNIDTILALKNVANVFNA